jgi:hypothetical protein
MAFHSLRLAAVILTAATVSACNSQSATDPKVAELEKRLADTEKQLADSRQVQKNESSPAIVENAAPVATPPPATTPPRATAGSTTPAGPKPMRPVRPPPESQKNVTPAQADREKAETERLIAEQRAVNAKQAEANLKLQEQIARLKPQEFTLAEGTIIPVRTSSELSTANLSDGSTFDGLLEYDLKSGETVLAKAGSRVTCVVVSSDPGGRVKGTASLAVTVRSVVGAKGNVIALKTDSFTSGAESTRKKDAVRTGIATGVGAIIGGIAGGGSGAAKGAGAGAAAGVGVDLATRGAAATIPAETLIEFRLISPATVTMQP